MAETFPRTWQGDDRLPAPMIDAACTFDSVPFRVSGIAEEPETPLAWAETIHAEVVAFLKLVLVISEGRAPAWEEGLAVAHESLDLVQRLGLALSQTDRLTRDAIWHILEHGVFMPPSAVREGD